MLSFLKVDVCILGAQHCVFDGKEPQTQDGKSGQTSQVSILDSQASKKHPVLMIYYVMYPGSNR